jgi:hypothetical protein
MIFETVMDLFISFHGKLGMDHGRMGGDMQGDLSADAGAGADRAGM